MITQSDGSEFGSCEGNEQTLISRGVPPPVKLLNGMVHSAEVSCGFASPVAKGSVLVWATSQSTLLALPEAISVGPAQRSTRLSLQE